MGRALAVALLTLLLAAGLAACGGGDSDSTATEATQGQSQGSQDEAQGGGAKNGGGGKSASGGGDASDFVPKHHTDSGGGSEQFKVKGGDNSVQEFGEEADASEREEAAAVLHDFLDARAQGNWAAACSYMSESVIDTFERLAAGSKQIKDKSCGGILGKLTNPAAQPALKEEAEKADVGSLRIEGERAFVIYTGIEGAVIAMPMANEDGEWKVASLAGTPIT